RAFCQRNPGRVLFGTDIVADHNLNNFTLYASRYWALRTLMETDHQGWSPIVDPDLHAVDPALALDATPELHGAHLDPTTLRALYQNASRELLEKARHLPRQTK